MDSASSRRGYTSCREVLNLHPSDGILFPVTLCLDEASGVEDRSLPEVGVLLDACQFGHYVGANSVRDWALPGQSQGEGIEVGETSA